MFEDAQVRYGDGVMVVRSIEARHPSRLDEARLLASESGVDVVDGPLSGDEYRIVLLEDREELWDAQCRRHGMPLGFRDIDRRTGTGNLSHKQPIARAVGSGARMVADLTAGFGHDACLLACMGWDVTAIERDPFIATILSLSVEDTRRDPALASDLDGRLRMHRGEALDWLVGMQTPPDVIYLDPMYELKRGSALPRKRAQVLQAVVEGESNGVRLLEAARNAVRRVVVKRPADGQPLGGPVDLVFTGRQVRYDVYLSTP